MIYDMEKIALRRDDYIQHCGLDTPEEILSTYEGLLSAGYDFSYALLAANAPNDIDALLSEHARLTARIKQLEAEKPVTCSNCLMGGRSNFLVSGMLICSDTGRYRKQNDFCSRGKRKEG